jgi:hypothetical protein
VSVADLEAWPVVARIWQTVDVDRTVADLGLPTEPIADDEVLGAHGVLVRPPDGPPLAIVEPSTEGRLAAALARRGEGDGGKYIASADGANGVDAARRAGLIVVQDGPGPFGRSTLVAAPGADRWSTFIVIVPPPPATIEP